MATAELTVSANLSGLRQQLESIPGLTAEQARLMTAELNKSIRASERAAKAAADASKRAMASASESAREAAADVGKVGDRFGTVGSSAGKLAGALSMLGPALGDSARNVADLADVGEVGALAFEGFGAVLLPLTATLALFAAGLAPIGELIVEEQRRAEATAAALKKYEAATAAAEAANTKFATSLSGVNDYVRIATGLESLAAQSARKRGEALRAEADAQMEATRAQIASADEFLALRKVEQDAITTRILLGKATEEEVAKLATLGPEIEAINAAQARRRARLEEVNASTEDSIEFMRLEAEAIDQVARNDKREAEAKAAREKASRAHAAALEVEAEKQRELDAIRARAQSVIDSELTQAGRIIEQQRELRAQLEKNPAAFGAVTAAIAVLDRQLEALDDQEIDAYLKRQADAAKELQTAFEALIPPEVPTRQEQFATLTDQVTEAMRNGTITFEDYQKKLKQIQEAQEETFSLEALAAFFDGVRSKTSQMFSDLSAVSEYYTEQSNEKVKEAVAARKSLGKDATEDERKQAKQRVEDAKDAARKAFEVNKALQIAQIVVNTAAAATQAAAAVPPPFNIPLVAAAIAAGAVQYAKVQSTQPKFHAGGLIGQPDEQTAIVRRGEAVLNPMGRSLLGDDTIRAANAGMGSGSGGHAVQVVYKHKSFDYFVRDHLRTNATLPRALNAGRRLGQRGG
jgi:hypothetical protein